MALNSARAPATRIGIRRSTDLLPPLVQGVLELEDSSSSFTRTYPETLRHEYLRTQRSIEERSDFLAYITPRLCNAVLDDATATSYLTDQRTRLNVTEAVIKEMALRVDTLRRAINTRKVPVLLAFANNAFSRELSGARDTAEKSPYCVKVSTCTRNGDVSESRSTTCCCNF